LLGFSSLIRRGTWSEDVRFRNYLEEKGLDTSFCGEFGGADEDDFLQTGLKA
jgi:hypothetical protein